MNRQPSSQKFVVSEIARATGMAIALIGVSLPLWAQSEKIEEVLVTSQKRTERLQDVPVAVKAFTASQIENSGIKSTQDFVNMTPNMSFDQSFTYNNSFVTLRGVTQINNADSPVAIVIDGVPQGNQKQLRMDLFDIDRIEVLKGPQGALYGRNAIGGAINIETKKATSKFESFASVGLGNANTKLYNAGLSGALTEDTAFYRLIVSGKNSDGLVNNTFLGQKVDYINKDDSLRAKFLFILPKDWTVDVRTNHNSVNAGATMDAIVDGGPSVIALPQSNMLGNTTGLTNDYSLKLENESGHGKLTAITAYTNLTEKYRGDIDFTYNTNPNRFGTALAAFFGTTAGGNPIYGPGVGFGQGQNLQVKMWSQEIRWASPAKDRLRYIVGVYYLDTKRDLETRAFLDTNGALSQYDTQPATPAVGSVNAFIAPRFVWRNESNHNKAPAYFAQTDYDITSQWSVSGGLRYDKDMRNQTDVLSGRHYSNSFSKWQPRINTSYKLNRNEQVYSTISTGFRSGGFNAPGVAAAQFKPESLTNYEVGYKTISSDGKAMFNAAAFVAKSKDFQYFQVEAATGTQEIRNIDQVTLKGFDIDYRWLINSSFELDGGLGYTDGNIDSFALHPDWVGKHTPKNVPLKINAGLQYSQALNSTVKTLARFDVEHRSQKYWHPDNVDVSPSINLFNLRLAVAHHKDAWSWSLTGRNIFNKQYYADFNSKSFSGLPYNIGSLAPGRTVVLEGKVRF